MKYHINNVFLFQKRETVKKVERYLGSRGCYVGAIYGEMKPQKRAAQLSLFRKGTNKLVVATDIIARGVDVANTKIIVNFDVPHARIWPVMKPDFKAYLHRLGRGGRFGEPAVSISCVLPGELESIKQIENHFNRLIQKIE